MILSWLMVSVFFKFNHGLLRRFPFWETVRSGLLNQLTNQHWYNSPENFTKTADNAKKIYGTQSGVLMSGRFYYNKTILFNNQFGAGAVMV
jgi:hypothetical protein